LQLLSNHSGLEHWPYRVPWLALFPVKPAREIKLALPLTWKDIVPTPEFQGPVELPLEVGQGFAVELAHGRYCPG